MPSKSPAQARMMRAIAHGWHKPGGGGPSKAVAQEFATADKGHKFGSGGHVKKRRKPGINPAMMAALSQPPSAPPGPAMGGPPPGPQMGGPPPGMKKGGSVGGRSHGSFSKHATRKVTKIPLSDNKASDKHIGGGIEKKGATATSFIGMKGAGIASKGTTPTHKYAGGGSVRGHGIETSGRTRGRFV